MVKIPADADILEPSDDHIFKAILTHPDAEGVLISLASAVLERPVASVQVRNNELPVSDDKEKSERLDVNCIVDGGDQIDVEMQASRMVELTDDEYRSFINKSIYYMTDLHSSQKSKGVKYRDLVRTYQVTFCEHLVFSDWPEFVSRISLRRTNGEQVSDQINMVIVEMSKLYDALKRPAESLTPLEMWSVFFKFAPDPEHRDFVNKIIEIKKEVGMASALLMEISKDEHERARLRSRRMYETDRYSDIATAEERGRLEEKKEIARGMVTDGVDADAIAKWTGLPVSDILRLK
jgi:predicted transposase/invertase (TIGR01784 family)